MFAVYTLVLLLVVASGTTAQICKPGQYYYDGCNNCTCIGGTGYACTLKYCEGNPVVCYTRGTTRKCTPGDYYYDGCNTCTCIGNGTGYACTKKACKDNPVVCYVK